MVTTPFKWKILKKSIIKKKIIQPKNPAIEFE